MPEPSADQVQMANEVLAGTRQITGTSAPPPASPEVQTPGGPPVVEATSGADATQTDPSAGAPEQAAGLPPPPASLSNLSDDARQQLAEIATPEFRAQVNATETSGYSVPDAPAPPPEPSIGAESRSIDRMANPLDAAQNEAAREEKRLEIKGPGE